MTMLRYNTGKAPLSLVPSAFFEAVFNLSYEYGTPFPTKLIWQVGQVLDFGAQKYTAHNWRKGGSWTSVLNSAFRHLLAMLEGRRIDPESGLSEAGHLGCNIAFLLEFAYTATGDDDRPQLQTGNNILESDNPLSSVLNYLLAFKDGGSVDDLRHAALELAIWVEAQGDETATPAHATAH